MEVLEGSGSHELAAAKFLAPKGVRVTVQARRNHVTSVAERHDPKGRPYFWIEEGQNDWQPHDRSDYQVARDGYVSVTPLHCDLTAHDILATIAFIGVMRLEVSLTIVAAVLSMVGYSLNDTIIIFDRVREDLKKYKKDRFETVLNRAINETLPRSVLTHGTTLATLIALAVFGGEVIRPFALVMFFGVFTGTFSSIYIASPVLMAIEQRWPGALARGHMGTTPTPAAPSAPGRKPQPVGR